MTQSERLNFLLCYLIKEQKVYKDLRIPDSDSEKRRLLRSLMNARPPLPVESEFLTVQNAYLQEETRRKGITVLSDLEPVQKEIYLWRGDITTLQCDAIVNAANSAMLGCFVPCHGCIDNAIHTYAGIQLRLACADMMRRQGKEEETGKAKITPAFNLPCDYVIHTVGPIVQGRLTKKDKDLLASCYRSCLELAAEKDIESIAFCCISTGEFRFPNRDAAEIAVSAVKEFREKTGCRTEVIFNVFKDMDRDIYRELLKEC